MTKPRERHRVDRQFGVNIWGRPNSPFEKRKYPLGQHGKVPKKKVSNYCLQLVSKQRIKTFYNVSERQLKKCFQISSKNKMLAPNVAILSILERRLDQIIYKLRLAPSIFAARQLVVHKHFMVDGAVMNVPSYLVKPGQVVSVRESSKNIAIIRASAETQSTDIPTYLKLESTLSGMLLKAPEDIKEIPFPFEPDPGAIVEKYSRIL
jgi:small subunit ribosomal protein S4